MFNFFLLLFFINDNRNYEPAVILSSMLSAHLNEVPLINDIKTDMLIEYSNADMEQINGEDFYVQNKIDTFFANGGWWSQFKKEIYCF